MTALIVAEVVSTLRAAGCVFAEEEADLILGSAADEAEVERMVRERVAGLPLEHVLGWATFHGLRIEIDPGVFVPRRRTEFLVDQAIAAAGTTAPGTTAPGGGRRHVVVDLCCGSGALGVAVAAELEQAGLDPVQLVAADIESAAVRCARRNVVPRGGKVYEGNLYAALPAGLRGRVDLLLANVPYVPTDEVRFLPPEARVHEPRVTLDGGPDGLELLRRVSADAQYWLARGGMVFVETSTEQAPTAAGIFAGDGLTPRIVTSPEDDATVVIGTLPYCPEN